tara:strand:+ start:482 stop:853 length:372 start_codon:yes stop_codon:yes gene_type:complete
MGNFAQINAKEINTLFRFIWEPGNRTRYNVTISLVEKGTKVFVALDPDGTGRGRFATFETHFPVTIHEVRDHIADGNEADAAAILSLLDRLGVEVMWPPAMPDWMKLAKDNAEEPKRSRLEAI